MNHLKRLKVGAFWVSLISILALPLTFARSWLYSNLDNTGIWLGKLATVLLFSELVIAFAMFGGISVITNFYPKSKDGDKLQLLYNYTHISSLLLVIFLVVLNSFPSVFSSLVQSNLSDELTPIMSLLAVSVFFSQISLYYLAGSLRFKEYSLLNQFPLLLTILVVPYVYFQRNEVNEDNLIFILALALIFSHLCIVIKTIKIRQCRFHTFSKLSDGEYFPKGFLKFSIFVHGNTLCTLMYSTVDKLIVLSKLGVTQLAAYFLIVQLSELIKFIPSRIGQVFLTTFSSMINDGKEEELQSVYRKLVVFFSALSGLISLTFIIASFYLELIFGYWIEPYKKYLIIMVTGINIGCIGSINAMLVMARENSVSYFFNSLVQVGLQLAVTLLLIEQYGVLAAVLGKVFGVVSAQIGLWLIIKKDKRNSNIKFPKEYFISQAIIISFALVCCIFIDDKSLIPVFLYFPLVTAYMVVLKFNPLKYLNSIRNKTI